MTFGGYVFLQNRANYLIQFRNAEYKANRIQNVRFASAIESSDRCELWIKISDFSSFAI